MTITKAFGQNFFRFSATVEMMLVLVLIVLVVNIVSRIFGKPKY